MIGTVRMAMSSRYGLIAKVGQVQMVSRQAPTSKLNDCPQNSRIFCFLFGEKCLVTSPPLNNNNDDDSFSSGNDNNNGSDKSQRQT